MMIDRGGAGWIGSSAGSGHRHRHARDEATEEAAMAVGGYQSKIDSGRSGWTAFAAIIMFAVAFLRIITAISYFANSSRVNDLTNGVFSGHLWAWGVWDLCIAALAFFAGLSLLGNGGFGRVVGYIWGIAVIVQSFLIVGQAPWYSLGMIFLGTLVIYGLASSSEA
jgi:hypothetical protein